MRLVNFRPPYHDELMISWIWNIADMNFIGDNLKVQRAADILFPYSKTPDMRGKITHEKVRSDFLRGTDKSLRHLKKYGYAVPGTSSFLSYHTPVVTTGIACQKWEQARRVHTVTSEATGDSMDPAPLPIMINKLKYCPECMKDEKYIRTWHNLPGVETCAKHGTWLYSLDQNEGHSWNCKRPVKADTEKIRYARYVKTVYENPSEIDLKEIRKYLIKEEHVPVKYLKNLTNNSMRFEELIALFIEYRIDYRKMLDLIFNGNKNSEFETSICPICGNEWTDHKTAREIGFGCPECMGKADPEKTVRYLLSKLGDGEYYLNEPFEGIGKSYRVLHKTCGEVTDARLTRRLWGRSVCLCEGRHTISSIQKMVDEISLEYIVENFEPHGMLIEIRHKGCGTLRQTQFSNFKHNPGCKVCRMREEKKKRREDLERVLGNEYRIGTVGFINDNVSVIHKPCNTYFTGKYETILKKGKRCPLCVKRIREERKDGKLPYTAALYMEISAWLSTHDTWKSNEHRIGEHDTRFYDALRELVRKGKIHRINKGVYKIDLKVEKE